VNVDAAAGPGIVVIFAIRTRLRQRTYTASDRPPSPPRGTNYYLHPQSGDVSLIVLTIVRVVAVVTLQLARFEICFCVRVIVVIGVDRRREWVPITYYMVPTQ
jgi:hypothetical protein